MTSLSRLPGILSLFNNNKKRKPSDESEVSSCSFKRLIVENGVSIRAESPNSCICDAQYPLSNENGVPICAELPSARLIDFSLTGATSHLVTSFDMPLDLLTCSVHPEPSELSPSSPPPPPPPPALLSQIRPFRAVPTKVLPYRGQKLFLNVSMHRHRSVNVTPVQVPLYTSGQAPLIVPSTSRAPAPTQYSLNKRTHRNKSKSAHAALGASNASFLAARDTRLDPISFHGVLPKRTDIKLFGYVVQDIIRDCVKRDRLNEKGQPQPGRYQPHRNCKEIREPPPKATAHQLEYAMRRKRRIAQFNKLSVTEYDRLIDELTYCMYAFNDAHPKKRRFKLLDDFLDYLERLDISLPDPRYRLDGEKVYFDPFYYALYHAKPTDWEVKEEKDRKDAKQAGKVDKTLPRRLIDVAIGPQVEGIHNPRLRPPIYLCERITGNSCLINIAFPPTRNAEGTFFLSYRYVLFSIGMHINDILVNTEAKHTLDMRPYTYRYIANECEGADGTVYVSCDWSDVVLKTDKRDGALNIATGVRKQSVILCHSTITRWYVDEANKLHTDGDWSAEDYAHQVSEFDWENDGEGEIFVARFGRSWIEKAWVDQDRTAPGKSEMFGFARRTTHVSIDYGDDEAFEDCLDRADEILDKKATKGKGSTRKGSKRGKKQ
jgi:hypothetical protein